jgi:hypothetical protein
MIKKLKSKLLTYLFKDWVMNETDLETLQVSKQFIRKREIEITGHVPVIGFRSHVKQ